MRGAVIDDISLARRIAGPTSQVTQCYLGRMQLALADEDVVSVREHDTLGSVWQMVTRTAFAELRYSSWRVAGAVAGVGLLFALPPLFVLGGIALAATGHLEAAALLGVPAVAAWALQAALYMPAIRYFARPLRWGWTLPLAGTLYGAMTVDSALQRERAEDRGILD